MSACEKRNNEVNVDNDDEARNTEIAKGKTPQLSIFDVNQGSDPRLRKDSLGPP